MVSWLFQPLFVPAALGEHEMFLVDFLASPPRVIKRVDAGGRGLIRREPDDVTDGRRSDLAAIVAGLGNNESFSSFGMIN